MGEEEKCEEDLFGANNIQKQGGMQDVLWSLLYGVGETRTLAAREIRKLTKSSAKSRAYLAAGGVIAPLVSMLKSEDAEAQEAALLALLNLGVRNERVIFLGCPELLNLCACWDCMRFLAWYWS